MIGVGTLFYPVPSDSDYKPPEPKPPVRQKPNIKIEYKPHHYNYVLADIERSWDNNKIKDSQLFTSRAENFGLIVTETYYINRLPRHRFPDYFIRYVINLELKKSINLTHYITVFKKTNVDEKNPEKKSFICDTNKAIELPLDEEIYPTIDIMNNMLPSYISKLVHNCNVKAYYRAICDDVIFKDSTGRSVGSLEVEDIKPHPILLSHEYKFFDCYSKMHEDH